MHPRVYSVAGALALMAVWLFAPVGAWLGHSGALVRFMTALGLLTGTTVGWLVQHTLHRKMTRHALTGAGWAASILVLIWLFRDQISGSSGLTRTALVVAYTGSLAWGLRLLFAPMRDSTSSNEHTRSLLIGIKEMKRGDEAPKLATLTGRRNSPAGTNASITGRTEHPGRTGRTAAR